MPSMGAVHVLLEHSNRGKKSIGIDVSTEKGLDLIEVAPQISEFVVLLGETRRHCQIPVAHLSDLLPELDQRPLNEHRQNHQHYDADRQSASGRHQHHPLALRDLDQPGKRHPNKP